LCRTQAKWYLRFSCRSTEKGFEFDRNGGKFATFCNLVPNVLRLDYGGSAARGETAAADGKIQLYID